MKWIRIDKQLPETNNDVLLFHKTSGVFMGSIDSDNVTWRLYYSDAGKSKAADRDLHQLTHWMPFPNKPKNK